MAQGNPADARHPVKGLRTGDRIGTVSITGAVAHDPANGDAVARAVREAVNFGRPGSPYATAVLVVAFPAERRRDVQAAIDAAVS